MGQANAFWKIGFETLIFKKQSDGFGAVINLRLWLSSRQKQWGMQKCGSRPSFPSMAKKSLITYVTSPQERLQNPNKLHFCFIIEGSPCLATSRFASGHRYSDISSRTDTSQASSSGEGWLRAQPLPLQSFISHYPSWLQGEISACSKNCSFSTVSHITGKFISLIKQKLQV